MPISAKRLAAFHARPEQAILEVHHGFRPMELYARSGMVADVTLADGKSWNLVPWRLSPAGVELVASSIHGRDELALGREVSLRLSEDSAIAQGTAARIASLHREGSTPLLGLSFETLVVLASNVQEISRGTGTRWSCDPRVYPTGVARNPLRLDDTFPFRVVEIGVDSVRIQTAATDRVPLPGTRLGTRWTFPSGENVGLALHVEAVAPLTLHGSRLVDMICFMRLDDRAAPSAFGEYLLRFGPRLTPRELRDAGLKVRDVTTLFEFDFAKTEEEYREVLELRRIAYSEAGKVARDTTAELMADELDERARIAIAKHRGRVVASVRLMFHNDGDKLEHAEFTKLPSDMPELHDLVEVTRVCTHPDYRAGHLFIVLMRQMTWTILQSGRRWLLGSSTEKLKPMYKRIGCRFTGCHYTHEALGRSEHEIILMDIPKAVAGRSINPLVWNVLVADLATLGERKGLITLTRGDRARIRLYRAFAPLARRFLR